MKILFELVGQYMFPSHDLLCTYLTCLAFVKTKMQVLWLLHNNLVCWRFKIRWHCYGTKYVWKKRESWYIYLRHWIVACCQEEWRVMAYEGYQGWTTGCFRESTSFPLIQHEQVWEPISRCQDQSHWTSMRRRQTEGSTLPTRKDPCGTPLVNRQARKVWSIQRWGKEATQKTNIRVCWKNKGRKMVNQWQDSNQDTYNRPAPGLTLNV